MLTGDVRPKTLDGIKRLAAEIGKERGIKHSVALNLAAQAASFANFRHAQKALVQRSGQPLGPYVLLTRYWHDKDKRQSGRETLKIDLPKAILEMCGKSALKRLRGFGDFRQVAGDHFICDTLDPTQSYARGRLCAAERSLRFTQHTGLLPSFEARKAYPNGSSRDQLPNSDHSTLWVDPENGQFILVDEPYSGAPDQQARAVWADRHGWKIAKTSWPGMYRPYDCDLYVVTEGRSGYDFAALVSRIEAMPAPLTEADWHGESSSSWETFASPLAKTSQDRRRARCRGTIFPVPSAKTVPYSYGIGSSLRRPAGQLGVAGHIEAGRIIKAVASSNQRPYAVYNRMNSVRTTLEDWMTLEIDRKELEGPEFFEVYYADTKEDTPYRERAKSRQGIVAMLEELKQRLEAGYPDCAPLRKQLHRIDISIKFIGDAGTANG
ncbi:DUF5623 domain-containing protein [Ciceribacter selenitireducens]